MQPGASEGARLGGKVSLTRRAPDRGEGLHPDVVDLLLHGWGHGFPLTDLTVFELSDLQLRDLWRRHQPELRAEAKRRGLTAIDAEEYFDLHPPEWLRESTAE
jgi:hypothetical protein